MRAEPPEGEPAGPWEWFAAVFVAAALVVAVVWVIEAGRAVVTRVCVLVGPATRVRLGGFEAPGEPGYRPRPGQVLVWGWTLSRLRMRPTVDGCQRPPRFVT